jgi:hypothetical protein
VLARDFVAGKPNEKWATDITYIWTAEGWLYLAVVLDLYSRRIVGWSTAEHMETSLCLDALSMAIKSRTNVNGTTHHSDRGVQYASREYRRRLKLKGLECSMSRRGVINLSILAEQGQADVRHSNGPHCASVNSGARGLLVFRVRLLDLLDTKLKLLEPSRPRCAPSARFYCAER